MAAALRRALSPSLRSQLRGARFSLSASPAKVSKYSGRGTLRGRLVTRFPPLSTHGLLPLPPFLSQPLRGSFSPRSLTPLHPQHSPPPLPPLSPGSGERERTPALASSATISGNPSSLTEKVEEDAAGQGSCVPRWFQKRRALSSALPSPTPPPPP